MHKHRRLIRTAIVWAGIIALITPVAVFAGYTMGSEGAILGGAWGGCVALLMTSLTFDWVNQ